MLILSEIFKVLKEEDVLKQAHNYNNSVQINNLEVVVDSRKLSKTTNNVFIAIKGENIDSHKYIDDELLSKISVLVVEEIDLKLNYKNISVFEVKSGRCAWAYLSAKQYGNPEKKLRMIGVTGTNGKSSIVWLFKELYKEAFKKDCLAVGTIGAFIGESKVEVEHTTPDPSVLYKLLKDAVDKDITDCIMEVSSHSIMQSKIDPIKFSAVVFSSFSQDHLDFHIDLQSYFASKWLLFSKHSKSNALKLINTKVYKISKQFLENYTDSYKKLGLVNTYGLDEEKSLIKEKDINHNIIKKVELSTQGSKFILDRDDAVEELETSLIGNYAIENIVASKLLVEFLYVSEIKIKDLSEIKTIPGRLESVLTDKHQKNMPNIIIDFAHTPDALKLSLEVLNRLKTTKLITVFGCGGDRDVTKRPLMAQAAEKYSDIIIVTSDNPRTEDPEEIIKDIIRGFDSKTEYTQIENRYEAIKYALKIAKAKDIILFAGKGHETYQVVGNKKMDFNERQIIKEILNAEV